MEAKGRAGLHLLQQGNLLFKEGQYPKAVQVYERGYQQSRAAGDTGTAIKFLNNFGSCQYALFQYREAIRAYLEARRLAESIGDWESFSVLSINLSSLYLQMGETNAAIQVAEEGLAALAGREEPKYKASLLAHIGTLRARTGDTAKGIPLLEAAIEEAGRQAAFAVEAQSWGELGDSYLRLRDLPAADRAILEAFRLRRLRRDERICFSYAALGKLRMLQGDPRSASLLMDRAVDSASSVAHLLPTWSIYFDRGELRMAQGMLPEALSDFETALARARRKRVAAPPADAFRVGTDVELQRLYTALIEAGNRLYFQTGRPALARQTFAAAEENRAASLRALVNESRSSPRNLPPAYWETLAQLHQAEVSQMQQQTEAISLAIRRLRVKLSEMEAQAGLDTAPSQPEGEIPGTDSLEHTQRVLGPDELLLSFSLADSESYLWAVARDHYQVCRIPPRARIAAAVDRFRKAVRLNEPEAAELGKRLYAELFGNLSSRLSVKPHWILALDGALFELPLAALVVGQAGGRPVFLAERHSVHVIPGALNLDFAVKNALEGPFLGVGDPIYNGADPRRKNAERFPASRLEMPRLVGSDREIETCARMYLASGAPLLLKGQDACKRLLEQALLKEPSVVHFATHMLLSADGTGLLALSVQPTGQPEFLSSTEIARLRAKLGLVVLSGCSSGVAEILPGAGLMGMTRAWLAAGAQAVIASRWPTPDDTGELFKSLYRHLRESKSAVSRGSSAVALQQAQLAMLQSGTWRSHPSYWAAYFAVEKD